MSDSVGQYLNEIGLVPLLTAEEERELSQIIEKGAERRRRASTPASAAASSSAPSATAAAAKDRFIRANLRLVVSVARRYPLPPGMELLDLIQEGNLGLEHAVDKFDWRKGFKFSTYATFWIRQAIGRALDQKASLVRLPGDRSASLRAALRQVSGDGDELDDEHARLHRLTTPTSLDRTIGDDDSNELIDLLRRRQARPRGPGAWPTPRRRWSPTCSRRARPPGPVRGRAALRPARRPQAQLPRGRRGARRHRRGRSPPGEASRQRRARPGRRPHRRRLTPPRPAPPVARSARRFAPDPAPGRIALRPSARSGNVETRGSDRIHWTPTSVARPPGRPAARLARRGRARARR